MNKEYLKEHNLLESQRQFRKLCEYTFIGADDVLSEDDVEDDAQNNQNQQQGDDMNNQSPMPYANNQQGQQDTAMQDNGNAENSFPEPAPATPQQNPPMPAPTPAPQPAMPDMGGEEEIIDMEGDDEEVIDVDELTDSQEETEHEVGEVNSKIDKLLSTIDTLSTIIQQNDSKILALKQEIEKRNPTPTEKLNLRSLDSYPFNVNPKDYWEGKAKTGNYEAYSDNDLPTGKEDEEYVITQDEIDGDNNFKSISDSLDDEYANQDFKKIFGY